MEKILIIDDSLTARAYTKTIVNACCTVDPKPEIIEAKSGEEALEILTAAQEDEFVLIISDLVMPGISGKELVQKLRFMDNVSTVPLVFLTSKSDKSVLDSELRATGAYQVLGKPLEVREFREILDDLQICCD